VSNNSAYSIGIHAPPKADLEAYDQLPAIVRIALQDAHFDYAAEEILIAIRSRAMSVPDILARLAFADRAYAAIGAHAP
jgi:hypothetical protein